jgi:uncharacterized protein (TIGR04255 family)
VHQIVWRFRNPSDSSKLFQIGPGLFSANALQPYHRWREFEPTVGLGVNALLASRSADEAKQSFSSVSLRYINAFSGELLGGRPPAAFINQVLGFGQILPAPISSLVDSAKNMSASTNLIIPIANTAKRMKLVVGDGVAKGEPAAVFDVTVTEQNVAIGDAMKSFITSRDIIRQCFLDLTMSIHDVMQPEGAT